MGRDAVDMAGQRVGPWVILGRAQGTPAGLAQWECECSSCGSLTVRSGASLRAGRYGHCEPCAARGADLVGEVFGRRTVVARADPPTGAESQGAHWLCRCECGEEAVVWGANLRRGSATSCKKCAARDDLLGAEFGDWLVIGEAEGRKWLCHCRCGREQAVFTHALTGVRSLACQKCARAKLVRTPEPCSVEGCDRGGVSKGMCDTHYRRWRKAAR